MLAKVFSGATIGLESLLVEVEVDVATQGLPSITIVGLASKAVDEARQRVRSAIKNSHSDYPTTRITINLAPADLPKEGPVYDLPIAIGLLIASGQIQLETTTCMFFGELSLDGTLRHTRGALPLTLLAKKAGFKAVYLPKVNASEVSIISDIQIFPVDHIGQLVKHLNGIEQITPLEPKHFESLKKEAFIAEFDFADIKGQETAKRVMEIAAAGGHNVYMSGPPGGGKTMMARALPGILPPMTEEEAIEVTKIYSISGNIPPNQTIICQRPFRSPHHTTSRIGLIGGGSKPMPGEISLSHRGVLFLDEVPEFPRALIESLRQPIEDGIVSISRAAGTMNYPARFMLIAAANPCPCGYYGSSQRVCACPGAYISKYQKKISGPIMDRMDLQIIVPEVELEKLAETAVGESSAEIRARVIQARQIQTQRYKKTKIKSNAELSARLVNKFCTMEPETKTFLYKLANKSALSARSFSKIIKTSRTIADLDGSELIIKKHISEAFAYRQKQE